MRANVLRVAVWTVMGLVVWGGSVMAGPQTRQHSTQKVVYQYLQCMQLEKQVLAEAETLRLMAPDCKKHLCANKADHCVPAYYQCLQRYAKVEARRMMQKQRQHCTMVIRSCSSSRSYQTALDVVMLHWNLHLIVQTVLKERELLSALRMHVLNQSSLAMSKIQSLLRQQAKLAVRRCKR
ncbi:MAG: hypothetical protein EP343_12135 [Deltaproteobacteria bacterium]|nr:MAG: hypothetical protein EP343_12135 [Deltaproteobacteria bacterium]